MADNPNPYFYDLPPRETRALPGTTLAASFNKRDNSAIKKYCVGVTAGCNTLKIKNPTLITGIATVPGRAYAIDDVLEAIIYSASKEESKAFEINLPLAALTLNDGAMTELSRFICGQLPSFEDGFLEFRLEKLDSEQILIVEIEEVS